jgi:DNA (cytosine-5)-methyltransferase 1
MRDLFAWAVETAGQVKPRALILENVKGLSKKRFAGYRQHVLDRLNALGYWADWRLLHAADFGVAQLRPRFVLVALRPEDAPYFHWPEPVESELTVGNVLLDLMAENGWTGANAWAARANDIAPTIVGGSKRHGGADLGPTRAKQAWRSLGVDAMGVADAAPQRNTPKSHVPRLTVDMVARIQGWYGPDYEWTFTGLKTSRYRQVGNAFPPPCARAVGDSVKRALLHLGEIRTADSVAAIHAVQDPIYQRLAESGTYVSEADLLQLVGSDEKALERHIRHLEMDFYISSRRQRGQVQYRLGGFRAFIGQDDHHRHQAFAEKRSLIS